MFRTRNSNLTHVAGAIVYLVNTLLLQKCSQDEACFSFSLAFRQNTHGIQMTSIKKRRSPDDELLYLPVSLVSLGLVFMITLFHLLWICFCMLCRYSDYLSQWEKGNGDKRDKTKKYIHISLFYLIIYHYIYNFLLAAHRYPSPGLCSANQPAPGTQASLRPWLCPEWPLEEHLVELAYYPFVTIDNKIILDRRIEPI